MPQQQQSNIIKPQKVGEPQMNMRVPMFKHRIRRMRLGDHSLTSRPKKMYPKNPSYSKVEKSVNKTKGY